MATAAHPNYRPPQRNQINNYWMCGPVPGLTGSPVLFLQQDGLGAEGNTILITNTAEGFAQILDGLRFADPSYFTTGKTGEALGRLCAALRDFGRTRNV